MNQGLEDKTWPSEGTKLTNHTCWRLNLHEENIDYWTSVQQQSFPSVLYLNEPQTGRRTKVKPV